MGSYTFRWPHAADEVFVTGTFDDWGKTILLDRKGDVFEKEVQLPATDDKIHYKFVVDGTWTTDSSVPEESDGHNNINNVLYPEHIRKDTGTTLQNGTLATMSGVTPDSTTAALAAGVPKTSSKDEGILGDAAFHSTAPSATTAELAKNVPLEQRSSVPGAFPSASSETDQIYSVNPIPASSGIGNPIQLKPGEKIPGFGGGSGGPSEAEQTFSVNPIPASSGIGNPIKLAPGEKVPDSSTFNSNTIQSTVKTDPASYEKSDSYPSGDQSKSDTFAVPPVSGNMIPESSLPMGSASQGTADPYIIQSAAPTSTTAALAANVPLESQKKQVNGTGSTPAEDVPDVVKQSIADAHRDPEAAANREVVEEKREMEDELQHKVPVDQSVGTPAPTAAAATTETAPQPTGVDSTQLSPRATTPSGEGPTVTTGADSGKAPEVSEPAGTTSQPSATVPAAASAGVTGSSATKTTGTTPQNGAKTEEKKKKKKGFFSRLKEKLKN